MAEVGRENKNENTGLATSGEKGESDGSSDSSDKQGPTQNSQQGKVSFRDKLIGNSSGYSKCNPPSLDVDRICVTEGKQGDPTPPSVTFSDETRELFSQPYKEAVVIKVLDKHLSYTALMHKLRGTWKLRGGFDLLDVGRGYFLAKFDLSEERIKVLTGGPWLLNGHYIAVKMWSPTFRSGEASFGSTLVWARIEGLPIWYYNETLMTKIASVIGIPFKVDLTTKTGERGRYARICLQIDLSLPVSRLIIVDGVQYEVDYENLQLLCELCNHYGHDSESCPNAKVNPVEDAATFITPEFSFQPPPSTVNCDQPEDRAVKGNKKVFEFGKSSVTNDCENLASEFQRDKSVFVANETEELNTIEEQWVEVKRKTKGKSVPSPRGTKETSGRVFKPFISAATTSNSNLKTKSNIKPNPTGKGGRVGKFSNFGSTPNQSVTKQSSVPASNNKDKDAISLSNRNTRLQHGETKAQHTPMEKNPHKRQRPGSLQNSPVESGSSSQRVPSSSVPVIPSSSGSMEEVNLVNAPQDVSKETASVMA